MIKGLGGATRLLNREEESSLLRWELCGSEITNLISIFENEINSSEQGSPLKYKKHHEDTLSFKERFIADVHKLSEAFSINPFDTSCFAAVNNKSIVFSEDIATSVKNISALGEKQFREFWMKRLVTANITKNNLRLPKDLSDNKDDDVKDPTLTPKMISYLRSAHQYRSLSVLKLFEKEIYGISQSISSNSLKLYSGTKADVTRRLISSSTQSIH